MAGGKHILGRLRWRSIRYYPDFMGEVIVQGLPNGRYVNNSTGFLGILPNAYSNNNQATIVAKNISVKGSNIGNLVFQAFDVSSSAGGAGSDIDIAYIKSDEKKTYTKWTFGGYYYG